MKVVVTQRLIENLQRLVDGNSVAFSAMPQALSSSLLKEGLLSIETHGSRKLLKARHPEALKTSLPRYNEALADLDSAGILTGNSTRAGQAYLSGNSKIRNHRSCPGFLVNSYADIECQLNGKPITVNPPAGSAVYIADWHNFQIPSDILIVGVENMENFLRIQDQRQLVDSFLWQRERGVLFVSRYAFSSDLMQWLGRIPNRYLHFGDFDLAGISIFISQFLPYVGNRGSYLIPTDIESRICRGSRVRYDDQYMKYSALSTDIPELERLISIIHKYRRCYDQEGYINNHSTATSPLQ